MGYKEDSEIEIHARSTPIYAVFVMENGKISIDIAFEELGEALKFKQEIEDDCFKKNQDILVEVHKFVRVFE